MTVVLSGIIEISTGTLFYRLGMTIDSFRRANKSHLWCEKPLWLSVCPLVRSLMTPFQRYMLHIVTTLLYVKSTSAILDRVIEVKGKSTVNRIDFKRKFIFSIVNS